jgi:deazaflavin-dependent oxidoreductase (nitroreductase family)
MKRRIVYLTQKYLFNPPVKALFSLGVVPPAYAILETRGRKTGQPRRTPVGNGLKDGTFWIVAEHGNAAGYVRNLKHDPHVRVKVRYGLRYKWREGTAHVLPDDSPRERQKMLGKGHPGRWLNALVVRTLGTDLLTIRIDLD